MIDQAGLLEHYWAEVVPTFAYLGKNTYKSLEGEEDTL